VTDKRPRRVVGSTAFGELERTKAGLIDKLRLRIEAEEIAHPNGRVLVFTAPSRPIGMPVAVEGAYWMRAGEELAPMTPDMLRRIFEESGPDFSAEICPKATFADLDPVAIEDFRNRWRDESGNDALRDASCEQLLADADLVTSEGVTYAALIFRTLRVLGLRRSILAITQMRPNCAYESGSESRTLPDRKKLVEVGLSSITINPKSACEKSTRRRIDPPHRSADKQPESPESLTLLTQHHRPIPRKG
jgi:hypothetical protein